MAQYSNNPRENFHISMMERQKNRTTPLTVEDFLKQMGGLNSMGVTAEQLQQKFNQKLTDKDIKQMYDNWKPYGSGDVKSNPATEAKISALNIPDRGQPPQGMQSVDNSVLSAPKASGGNYKDGEIVYQDGKKFIAHNNNLYTPSIVFKDKNLFNKYSNLISNQEIGDANGPPPAVAIDNSVISAPGGGVPPSERPKPTGVAAAKPANMAYKDGQVVTQNGVSYIAHGGKLYSPAEVVKDKNLFNKYGPYSHLVSNKEIGNANGPAPPKPDVDKPPAPPKPDVDKPPAPPKPDVDKPPAPPEPDVDKPPAGVNPANDPNNLPYNNPESNKPILPTSYSGQTSLPTDPYEMQLMDYLKKQFEDKTWENKYNDLQKQYQELADRPDKYSGMIEKAGGEDVAGYIKSLYEGSADPLRREAQRMQDENAANLAARGLGMSTVVNDVNSGVQRELMGILGDLSNKANVQGRDMYLNALKSAADVYGQHGAQQGNALNAMQTNIGNQMGAQQIGLANINDILAKQEARRLTNMQTGINQWDKDVANYWKYMYYPIDAYAGQNSTANTAAQVGTNQYNQAMSNAATQNQTAGQVNAIIAQNMFKQPQNFTYQPISGGLVGAQQGAQAGFNTKPKPGQ